MLCNFDFWTLYIKNYNFLKNFEIFSTKFFNKFSICNLECMNLFCTTLFINPWLGKNLHRNEIQIMVKMKVDFSLIIMALFAGEGRSYHFLLGEQRTKIWKHSFWDKCNHSYSKYSSVFLLKYFAILATANVSKIVDSCLM